MVVQPIVFRRRIVYTQLATVILILILILLIIIAWFILRQAVHAEMLASGDGVNVNIIPKLS